MRPPSSTAPGRCRPSDSSRALDPLRGGHRAHPAQHRRAEDLRHHLRHHPGRAGIASETLNVFAFKTGFEFFRAGYAASLLIFLLVAVLGVSVLLDMTRRSPA